MKVKFNEENSLFIIIYNLQRLCSWVYFFHAHEHMVIVNNIINILFEKN